ncbi:MAG: fasciclin domain-containing protein [Pelagibaca sp.]
MNIVDIAAGSEDFSILVTALNTAGLTDTVRAAEDITVFAPTNAAFAALAVDLGFDGDTSDGDAVFGFIAGALTDLGGGDPIPLLTDILLYHVAPGARTEPTITGSEGIATLLDGAEIAPAGGALVDGEPDLLDPVIVVPDVVADNGIIQGIDRVLVPIDIPGNDRDTITGIVAESGGTFDSDASDFDLLLNALQAAGLTGALDNPDSNLTVFAPNDAAFVAAAQALGFQGSDEAGAFDYIVQAVTLLSFGNDPVPLLSDILLYHVAPGALDSGDVLGSASIDTLLGAGLGVDGTALVDGEPDLPDANIIATDIAASNGFVHVIDGVLVPVDLLPSNGAEDAVAFVIGDDTSESFTLGDNDDYVSAGGGDDTILGDDGSDVILGGDGEDTVEISGDFDDFEFLFGPNGVAVTDKTDVAEGTDFLKDVEHVRFDDGSLDLSVLTGAAQLAPDQLQLLTELYVAYFDRAPDAGGLLFWGTSLANGVSLPEIAALFFEQPETQEKMPDGLSSEAFVTRAYNNFLERDPDAAGLEFWVGTLEAGTVSRSEFMLALIEGARADTGSPEDVRTIEDKGDIGVSFALINGLNNVDDAEAVMAAYTLTDRAESLAEAQRLTTDAAADANGADGTTEFTFQLVGVIDDPFAMA